MNSSSACTDHLYHGTGIYCLAAIAQDNVLREGGHWGKPGEPHGPRLSRDCEQATPFIGYSSYWGEGGLVVVSRQAAERLHPVVSHVDAFYGGDRSLGQHEQEEAVLTPALNLTTTLVSLVCDPRVIDVARDPEWMTCAQEEGGWPFGHEEDAQQRALQALDALAGHPQLNAWVPTSGFPLIGNFTFPERETISARRRRTP